MVYSDDPLFIINYVQTFPEGRTIIEKYKYYYDVALKEGWIELVEYYRPTLKGLEEWQKKDNNDT